MLQTIRQKLTGWVAGVILLLIGVPFIFWGVGDYQFAKPNVIAQVNGEDIDSTEILRAYRAQLAQFRQMYQGELPEAMQQQVRLGVVQRFVNGELLQQHATEAGYRVGNEEVIESIRSDPAFQVGDEFSIDSFRSQLAARGLSDAGYETRRRQDLQIVQLQRGITDSAFVTQDEIDRVVALESEQRELGYMIFDANNYVDEERVSDVQIDEYYAAHMEEYMTEESVSLQYLELTGEDVGAAIDVSEDDLLAYYDRIKERYVTEEERRARHILVSVDDDEDEVRERAQTLYERITGGGEDFAELAKEHSDDATATDGGDLGFAGRGMFVGAFEDALFEMLVGEVRGPIRTEFGFHIIRLDEIKQGSAKSFEEVREEVEAEYRRDESEGRYFQRAEELADAAFDSLYELESVSDKLGLPLQTVEVFTRRGGGPFGADPKVVEAAFSYRTLQDGENSAPLEISDNQVIVLRVAEHRQPQQKPLEGVRSEIRTTLSLEAARDDTRVQGEAAAERLRSDPDLQSIAQEFAANFSDFRLVSRREPGIAPELIQAAFQARQPSLGAPFVDGVPLSNGNYAVVKVLSVKPGDLALASREEQSNQQRQIAERYARADMAAYLGVLRDNASVLINEEAFQQ